MEKVDLETAFAFTCPSCAAHNFVATIAAEMTADDAAEVAMEMGVDGDDLAEGEWVMAPKTVKCKGCGERFETKHPSQESPDAPS